MGSMTALRPLSIPSVASGDDINDSSDTTAIPNDASGVQASTVLVTVTADAYVRPVVSGGTVTNANGVIITPECGGMMFNVRGLGASAAIAYLQVSGVGRITIAAVEM